MSILKFKEFVNESYLEGSRAPIYHYTSLYNLNGILDSDLLKMGRMVREPKNNRMAIALTRNPYFTHDGYVRESPRIVLDLDKLKNDGIISYPVDEIGIAQKQSDGNHTDNFSKSGFSNIKSGKRGTAHNLDLPKDYIMEIEFEERIYQNIKNLGKYIISIEFASSVELNDETKYELGKYLEKYPHIKVNKYGVDERSQVTDITNDIVEFHQSQENEQKERILDYRRKYNS